MISYTFMLLHLMVNIRHRRMIKFVLVVLAWSACLTGDVGGLVSAERTESLPQPPVTWNKYVDRIVNSDIKIIFNC